MESSLINQLRSSIRLRIGSDHKRLASNGIKKHLRVAIISERRADYARFKPILSLMQSDPFFDYKLIVTGISLLKSRGEDIRIIKKDGFKISAILPMYRENAPDTGAEMTRAYGRVIIGLADTFERFKPDLILTGFDIGANFMAAIVGAHMNIPVAHIQGGEVTGSIDESLRHATSKFAHIHFPATKNAAKRLIRMGEDPRFVFTVGCPSIDTLLQASKMLRGDIMRMLELDEKKPYVLIVQHPVTTEYGNTGWQMTQILRAVKETGVQGIVLYPNADAGSRAIVCEIKNSDIRFFRSLPPEIFANVLRHSAALVGNSSSGIHETATLKIPTVNIGTRQQGRERPGNVIDVGYTKKEIIQGITKALFNERFQKKIAHIKNLYGDGKSAHRIVAILKKINFQNFPIQKVFVD